MTSAALPQGSRGRAETSTLALAVTALAFVVLFAQPMATTGTAWWNDPDAGHGLLLVPLAFWLAWRSGLAPRRTPQPGLGLSAIVLAVGFAVNAVRARESN